MVKLSGSKGLAYPNSAALSAARTASLYAWLHSMPGAVRDGRPIVLASLVDTLKFLLHLGLGRHNT